MPPNKRTETPEEKKNVVLRTTASVLEHALKQMALCGVVWPEYMDDLTSFRHSVENIVEHARQVGYVGDDK
jgi:hypothetical protein